MSAALDRVADISYIIRYDKDSYHNNKPMSTIRHLRLPLSLCIIPSTKKKMDS